MPVVLARTWPGRFWCIYEILDAFVRAVGFDPDEPRVQNLIDDREKGIDIESRLPLRIQDDGVGGRKAGEPEIVPIRFGPGQLGEAHLRTRPDLVHHDDRLSDFLFGDGRQDAGARVRSPLPQPRAP